MSKEADIHFELYRHLQNTIDAGAEYYSKRFTNADPEREVNSGYADIVVEVEEGEPFLVIEAKREPVEEPDREIDPYSPKVIDQAFGYAGKLGAPYFATYNGQRLVLFQTFEGGTHLLDRRTRAYEVQDISEFNLLSEIAGVEAEEVEWDPHHRAFVKRLDTFHGRLASGFRDTLNERLDGSDFEDRYEGWIEDQGWSGEYDDNPEQVHQRFVSQAAYLLMNKLLFYKLLEDAESYDVPEVKLGDLVDPETRRRTFDDLINAIDFEAVYEQDPIFDALPLTPRAESQIEELLNELEDYDLTRFDHDVIGQIYEEIIPADERHDLGQYYTPPAVVELITEMVINGSDDVVLDPACGSGGFLVKSYNKIKGLKSNGSHEEILDQLYGVDINRFPAHLSAINLALQDLSSETSDINVEVNDFFNVEPGQVPGSAKHQERAGTSGPESNNIEDAVFPDEADAVVANPPYIRQENIADKERCRQHLSHKRINSDLSKRSDIYSYFITHGTEFIREGGRLGFITSDRWLDARYGTDLQEFILGNYEIDAIVKFDRQAFEDALIGSSVILLTKQDEKRKRDSNITKFLRIKESVEVDEIVAVIMEDIPSDRIISSENYRVVTRTQQDLSGYEKWMPFFIAPPLYLEILDAPEITRLENVANVSYGKKTGANKFFCKRSEDIERLDLEPYTTSLLKATGQVNKIAFTEADAEEWGIIDTHDLVEKAREDIGQQLTGDMKEKIKEWMSDNGHEPLVSYIKWGEGQGYHKRSTFTSRDVWFDLEDLPRPPLLHTQFTWREHRVIWNEAKATATNQFHCINGPEEVDDKLLCALLNSRVAWLVKELVSRITPGQGMTRIQTMVYETEMMALPDPRSLTQNERDQIINRFEELVEREKELGNDITPEMKESERDKLDRAVLATLDMEDRLEELKQAVSGLVAMREKGAGRHTEVMVERTEEQEVIDLAGARRIENGGQQTLDNF